MVTSLIATLGPKGESHLMNFHLPFFFFFGAGQEGGAPWGKTGQLTIQHET